MKLQKLEILILLTFLISSATAQSSLGGWGIITSDTEAETDQLEKNYNLELLNTANNPVTIQLSASESPNYEIEFKDKILTIEPSETTKNPQGSGWFYSGNGQYVNLTETSFKVDVEEERTTNDIQFNITAQTVTENSEGEIENTQAQIVNQRNFEYQLNINQMLIREIDQEQRNNETEEQENQTSNEQENVDENAEDQSQNETSAQTDKQSEEEQINSVTAVLVVLILGLVMFLLK